MPAIDNSANVELVDEIQKCGYGNVAISDGSLPWTWDEDKNRNNKQKHGLGFETAKLVFDDPLMAHWPDPNSDEERWHTIGLIGNVVVVVAHTWPKAEHGTDVEVGRIISARKATAHERRAYEEGNF